MMSVYRVFAYFGLASVFGAMLYGFRFDAEVPGSNVMFNIVLYLAFAVPHLIMTRGWFKEAVWGQANGSPKERRVYITVGVGLWFLVLLLHRPLPGPAFDPPEWLRFVGTLGFLLSVVAFFEGSTFAALDGLLGMPGSHMSHSHGGETPLLTEGAYGRVRHPMYRAALLGGLCSVLIHGTAAAAFWAFMIGSTFVIFIPIEERQLIAARGQAYLDYRQQTPYRLFRGVW